MQETDRYAQYETKGKHLPEEAPAGETLHQREEIVALRAQDKAKIRHRLIGGLILVLTGVALGPMLFDEAPPMRPSDAKTVIPPIEKEPLNKIYIPVEAALSDQQPGQAPAGGLGLSKLDQRQDLTKVKPTEVSPQAAPQDVNVEKGVKSEENGAYFIQVLATSSEAGAMKAMSRFQALGFPVHSVRVQKKSATLWRVRLGHFKTREQAEEAVVYLDRRKIAHLAIQSEKGAQKPATESSPKALEVAKPVAKIEPKTEKPQVKPAVVTKPVVKSEVKKALPAKATNVKPAEKKSVKKDVKPAAKPVVKANPKPVSKTASASAKPVTKKVTKNDDPLAATLKAAQAEQKTSGDFIAEQIARERKK